MLQLKVGWLKVYAVLKWSHHYRKGIPLQSLPLQAQVCTVVMRHGHVQHEILAVHLKAREHALHDMKILFAVIQAK